MIGIHSYSEVGGHSQNEDAFRVETHPNDADCWLCFVADGQGGRPGGGPAAQLACEAALASSLAFRPEVLTSARTWPGIIRQADAAVARDSEAGFTTLVALCAHHGRVAGASCGDSAAIILSGENAKQLTAAQQKNPAVGSGEVDAVPFAVSVKDPWRLVVMTDGVWKYVGWDHVIEAARRTGGKTLINELRRSARLPGNGQLQDDFTIVVLESEA